MQVDMKRCGYQKGVITGGNAQHGTGCERIPRQFNPAVYYVTVILLYYDLSGSSNGGGLCQLQLSSKAEVSHVLFLPLAP
jgi:hypothetical protein